MRVREGERDSMKETGKEDLIHPLNQIKLSTIRNSIHIIILNSNILAGKPDTKKRAKNRPFYMTSIVVVDVRKSGRKHNMSMD